MAVSWWSSSHVVRSQKCTVTNTYQYHCDYHRRGHNQSVQALPIELKISLESNCGILKPTIHYSQTWWIGDEIIFLPNKILLMKMRRTYCCTLFVVHRQFSRGRRFFFGRKNTLCSSTRPLPRRKSCVQRTTKNLFMKHGERLLYTIRCTLFFRHFAPISLLFANSV